MFKSIDGGANWELLSRDIKFSAIGTYRGYGHLIDFDSSDSSIMYAGSHKDGVFKSTNSGTSWSVKGLVGTYINSLFVHPLNNNIIYVSAQTTSYGTGGVYKSTDGGDSWIQKLSADVKDLAIDYTDVDIVYVITDIDGIYKSTDGGDSWTARNIGIFNYLTNIRGKAISVDPSNSNNIFVDFAETNYMYRYPGLFKSSDKAESWQAVPSTQPSSSNIDIAGWWRDAGWFNAWSNRITIDPTDSSKIYISDAYTVWRTNDSGQNWSVKPWGLETTVINDIEIDPTSHLNIYVGMADNGFFCSTDGGVSFNRASTITGGNIYSIAVDPSTSPSTVYIGNGNSAILKSCDGCSTWTELTTMSSNIMALEIDYVDTNILYAGLSTGGIYKSTNYGQSWHSINTGLPSNISINALSIDPNVNTTLYISSNEGIYKSTDGGSNWDAKNGGLGSFMSGAKYRLSNIAIDKNNSEIMYVGSIAYGVYKSTNSGDNWSPVLASMDVTAIGIKNINKQLVIYAACMDLWYSSNQFGIYQSLDNGNTWKLLNDPPNSWVKVIKVDPVLEDKVVIGTTGNGIFRRSGIVTAFQMEEGSGTNIIDLTEYANSGTINGATWISTAFGYALSFDGVDDFINVPNSISLNLEDEITLEADIYWKGLNSDHDIIFSKGWETYALWITPSGNLQFKWMDESNNWHYTSIDFTPYINQWVQVAAVYDGRYATIYIDGNQAVTPEDEGTHTIKISGHGLGIGGRCSSTGSGGSSPFYGEIAKANVYECALSAENIKEKYLNSVASLNCPIEEYGANYIRDRSENTNDGIVYGAQWVSCGTEPGSALSFDGVDDFVDVPNSDSLDVGNGITMEAKVFWKGQNDTNFDIIFSKGWETYALWITPSGNLQFKWMDELNNWHYTGIDFTPYINQWVQVAAVYDGRYATIYIDGNQAVTPEDEGAHTIKISGHGLGIGGRCSSTGSGGSSPFYGEIAEARVYRAAIYP